MSLNITWSVLAKGLQPSRDFSRKIDSFAYKETSVYTPVINLLVPFGDNLFRSFRIEQLTKLLLKSDLRERALALDTINTYEQSTLSFPEKSASHTFAPVTVLFFEDAAKFEETDGIISVFCTVDPIGLTLTTPTDINSFTYTNNLSSLIEIVPGRLIRLQGTLPTSVFQFVITYVEETKVDWPVLIENVNARTYDFTDQELREVFSADTNWVNQVSAITLLAVENSVAAIRN